MHFWMKIMSGITKQTSWKKNLQKAIMNFSMLLNKYKKEDTEATKSAYRRQENCFRNDRKRS